MEDDDDLLDIGSTIRQNAVKGFNAAKDYMNEDYTVQAGRAFMQPDAPGGRAVSAVQNAIPTERGIVEGIRGATDAVVGGLSTLGDGVVEGGRMVGAGASQLADNASSAYSQAAPYFNAAARGASGGLNAIASNAAEGARQLAPNFTTATAPPEGAPLRDRSRLLSGGDARLPAPHRVGEAVGQAASAVGDFFTPSNPTPNPLIADSIGDAARGATQNLASAVGAGTRPAQPNFLERGFNYLKENAPKDTHNLAPGAQAGASSTTADNIADQARGTAKPGDAFSPVTEGSGIDIQGKANEARANQSPVSGNSAYDIITNPIGQAQASHENYREATSRDNYRGLNSPDTAPTRLPSQGQAITNPLGGGQLNTTGGIVSASSARSAPGDAPYLGGGNAPLSRATGRTTGDGSSNPNSPNFPPVGLGGVPIQSRDQWLAQRSAEKDALYQRRLASDARDAARSARQKREEMYKSRKGEIFRELRGDKRVAAMAELDKTYLGSAIKASGDDKALAGNLNRDSTGERIASAKLGADANQDAISNQAARAAAAATGQKNSFDQEYKQARLGQYQAGINETARRNAVLQRKEEHTLGLNYARNARDRAAARRAELAAAADPNNMNLSLASLGDQSYYQREQARINAMSQEELAEYRKNNTQTP